MGDVNPEQFYGAPWRRICKRAGVGHLRRKDLRDTFASWLVSFGIPTKYVADQLGHKHTTTTENHYAKWVPRGYVEPARLQPGEVPADLLAPLEQWHHSDTTSALTAGLSLGARAECRAGSRGSWWAAGDSNPKPTG